MVPANPGQQSQWLLSGVAHNFYETSKTKRARASLRAAYHHASECHRKLWPGIQVPPIQTTTGSDQDGTDACICTSLLVAYITHMLTQSKRSAQFRHRSYELLKSLIEQLAVHGPKLDFMMSDIQGRSYWMTQTLATPHACMPWTKEFFQRHLQMTWMTDLANKDIPWVTSYPTQGQIHLADWLAFSLDIPAWVANKKANKEILWAKQIVERSALAVVTQLALRIEENIHNVTVALNPVKKQKRLRIPKAVKWSYVASAMDMIFSGHDSKLVNSASPFISTKVKFQFLMGSLTYRANDIDQSE